MNQAQKILADRAAAQEELNEDNEALTYSLGDGPEYFEVLPDGEHVRIWQDGTKSIDMPYAPFKQLGIAAVHLTYEEPA